MIYDCYMKCFSVIKSGKRKWETMGTWQDLQKQSKTNNNLKNQDTALFLCLIVVFVNGLYTCVKPGRMI